MEAPDSNISGISDISDKSSGDCSVDEKHEFALFLENLSEILEPFLEPFNSKPSQLNNGQGSNLKITDLAVSVSCKNPEIVIKDQDMIHRVLNVIRLEIGCNLIIFDKNINANFQLLDFHKKKDLKLKLINAEHNKIIKPHINFFLPILKRESLESSLYACQELGVNEITIIKTVKTQKIFNHQRATKILVSAAEQSKNFNISKLNLPINLEQCVNFSSEEDSVKIFFDSEGEKFNEVVDLVKNKLSKNINLKIDLIIGPEADLTEKEKLLLKHNRFIFCKLTPTILRACQATNVAIGAFRAILD